MWGSAGYWLKEDLELPETPMHLEAKGDSVTWPVDIGTFDQIDHTNVEHIEDSNGGFSRFVLL
jgi:hypothetical protein